MLRSFVTGLSSVSTSTAEPPPIRELEGGHDEPADTFYEAMTNEQLPEEAADSSSKEGIAAVATATAKLLARPPTVGQSPHGERARGANGAEPTPQEPLLTFPKDTQFNKSQKERTKKTVNAAKTSKTTTTAVKTNTGTSVGSYTRGKAKAAKAASITHRSKGSSEKKNTSPVSKPAAFPSGRKDPPPSEGSRSSTDDSSDTTGTTMLYKSTSMGGHVNREFTTPKKKRTTPVPKTIHRPQPSLPQRMAHKQQCPCLATTFDPPLYYKDDMLGQRVDMLFQLDDNSKHFYTGTVVAFKVKRRSNGTIRAKHKIFFDDGESRWVDLVEEMQTHQIRTAAVPTDYNKKPRLTDTSTSESESTSESTFSSY